MNYMLVFPLHSSVETLIPNMTIFGMEPFGGDEVMRVEPSS